MTRQFRPLHACPARRSPSTPPRPAQPDEPSPGQPQPARRINPASTESYLSDDPSPFSPAPSDNPSLASPSQSTGRASSMTYLSDKPIRARLPLPLSTSLATPSSPRSTTRAPASPTYLLTGQVSPLLTHPQRRAKPTPPFPFPPDEPNSPRLCPLRRPQSRHRQSFPTSPFAPRQPFLTSPAPPTLIARLGRPTHAVSALIDDSYRLFPPLPAAPNPSDYSYLAQPPRID